MTTALALAAEPLDTPQAVVALLRRLGYPAEMPPVRSIAQRDDVCSIGELTIYVSTGDETRERDVVSRLSQFARRNILTAHVLFHLDDDGTCNITYVDAESRSSLRVAQALSPTDENRLRHLDITRAGEFADPRELFRRLLDRDQLTRRFFARFKSAVERLVDALRVGCPAEGDEELHDHAMLLLSRLLFLSFIQEKGWLDGNPNFLQDQLAAAIRRGDDFHSTTLLALFFGCLNTPIAERDLATRGLGRIPYLNGGLFHPSSFELRNRIDLLDNDLLDEVISTVFSAFEFTVDEQSTSVLHIDPEMLGFVFESLMAGDRRADSGSFYTPRRVVDRLVRRAVHSYLADGNADVEQSLDAGCLEALSPSALTSLDARLRSIRVLDPACGSGAFLLGALYCLEDVYRRIASARREPVPSGVRRKIIEESLFGVDVSSEAVRLCELRLWLAIVAPLGGDDGELEPLPNLDRNIYQGNSLIDPADALVDSPLTIHRDWSIRVRQRTASLRLYRHGTRDEKRAALTQIRAEDRRVYRELLERARVVREAELNELDAQQSLLEGVEESKRSRVLRKAAEEKLADVERAIRNASRGDVDFFSYRVQFADILSDGGFQCVIGNPPWVRHARISATMRRKLAERYRFFRGDGSGAFRQSDLALVFCERALSLVAEDGAIAFLLPSKVMTSEYASEFRAAMSNGKRLLAIDDWSTEGKTLFAADTFPIGLTYGRRANEDGVRVAVGDETRSERVATLSVSTSANTWNIRNLSEQALLRRLHSRFDSLESVLQRKPLMGVKTGANALFFLSGAVVKEGALWIGSVRIPLANVCRVVRGRAVRRWSVESSEWMLWSPNGRFDGRAEWVRQFTTLREVAADALRMSYVRPEHLGVKLLWKDLATEMSAVVAPPFISVGSATVPLIPNQTTYFLDCFSLEEAHQLAAVLNSTVVDVLLRSAAEVAKDGHYRFFGATVARVPFPSAETLAEAKRELIRLSRRAHATRRDPETLDSVVGAMYELSARELNQLQRSVRDVR